VATEGDAGRGSLEGSVSAETGEGSAVSVVEGESVAGVASAGTGSDTTRTGEASGRVIGGGRRIGGRCSISRYRLRYDSYGRGIG